MKEMGLPASHTPGDEFDLAAAVFNIFLKIFFSPEVGEKLDSAGKLLGRNRTGVRGGPGGFVVF